MAEIEAAQATGGRGYSPGIKVDIDLRDGTASLAQVDRHSSEQGSMPFAVFQGTVRRYGHSLSQGSVTVPSAGNIRALAEGLQPLVDRVSAGESAVRDGSNHIDCLVSDACEAENEIHSAFEDADGENDRWMVWHVGDRLGNCTVDDLPADGEALIEEARRDDVIIHESADEIDAHLAGLRAGQAARPQLPRSTQPQFHTSPRVLL